MDSGNATELLNEWTSCMRSHGDPQQADPTVDASKAIHVVEPSGYTGTVVGPSGQDPGGAGVICQMYIQQASSALNNGQPPPTPSPEQMDKYAECMRASGVPDFSPNGPGPGSGPGAGNGPGSNPNSANNPNSPVFQKASQECGQKVNVPSLGGETPGMIEIYLPDGTLGSKII